MGEMNRAVAGHGSSTSPFSGGTSKPKGRLASMVEGMAAGQNQLAYQHAQNEHDIRSMVTKHVLAKDMHSHVHKNAEEGTQMDMDYEGIKTGNIKRTRKQRTTAPAVDAPGETPHVTEQAPASEPHTNNAPVVAKTIPTHPGTWEGGWAERGPKGQMQTKPGYKEFKARKAHFEEGIAAQSGHFAVKEGIKIPNYARKAMTPKQPRKPRGK